MNKRDLARAVKEGAAGIVESLDLSELLGDDVFNEILDDQELMEFATQKQRNLSDRIRSL